VKLPGIKGAANKVNGGALSGGKLSVTSEAGKGSVFTLQLPAVL